MAPLLSVEHLSYRADGRTILDGVELGHMDCLELVRDRAQARAEPIVDVSHPLAKVTHEAAADTVDQNQLETLMAHGLTPDEAIELIVTGILR